MALRTVTMAELRLEVLLEAEQSGMTVAEVCRRYKISRETYYRYRRHYLAAGIEGLEDQSRRPRVSPGQIDAALEAEICRMRRAHPRWGARRIHGELARAGIVAPAVSTIHQALRRNHLVADQPPRRSKALTRFEREVTNDCGRSTPPRSVSRISTRRTCSMSSMTTRAICSLRSPPMGRPERRRGTASKTPPPVTGCRARCSRTTGCVSPVACMA
jgi:transposase-like protein